MEPLTEKQRASMALDEDYQRAAQILGGMRRRQPLEGQPRNLVPLGAQLQPYLAGNSSALATSLKKASW